MTIFERAGLQAALADHDAVRNAEQLRIGEFDTRSGVAIIVQHLDAGSASAAS